MIDKQLSFALPHPLLGRVFETDQIGTINFLVGPNGSGKSQFANALFQQLKSQPGGARLLGTDRLSEMAWAGSLRNYLGDNFAAGYAKNHFPALRAAGGDGSGIDTIVLLDERMDLRIRIEATLSHLFGRTIRLDWDSGNLIPRVQLTNGGVSYRLDREECHGIKELLVLLTHLYDDKNQFLIIDEPELNLHPQYQAFFMEEVRKTTTNPHRSIGDKVTFLITHSPFILDLRTMDDLRSIISFDLEYSTPKQVANLALKFSSPFSFIRKLNAHHKQLFFSDKPIFVEGIHDAWFVESMMEARGVSVAGAGSCIIDAGGVEQVNNYLELCTGLDKQAYYLYDLDSLFNGNLRDRIKNDKSIKHYLMEAGHGTELNDYCSSLERKLTHVIDDILLKGTPCSLQSLLTFLRGFGATRSAWNSNCLPKARTALVTALSRHKHDLMKSDSSNLVPSREDVSDILGRITQIVTALKSANIYVLPGGTLERYLPHYSGDFYNISEKAKARAINKEINELNRAPSVSDLSNRYGELYDVIQCLPSKAQVDIDPVLRSYLSDYIHELQKAVKYNPTWSHMDVQERLNERLSSLAEVFSIRELSRGQKFKFDAVIEISDAVGGVTRMTRVSDDTNAGMGDFQIERAKLGDESP